MVRLVAMDPAEFDPYFEAMTEEYLQENIRAGRWSAEEAPTEVAKQLQGLLPSGRSTPNHWFFTIRSEASEETVGTAWLAVEPRGAFVYDIKVFEEFRRRGYAEGAMRLLEAVAREQGATKILLHVFGYNAGARKLYQKLGYAETNVMMAKPLVR